MNLWLQKGAERKKLNMVIPFFGFQFTKSKTDQLERTFIKAYSQVSSKQLKSQKYAEHYN